MDFCFLLCFFILHYNFSCSFILFFLCLLFLNILRIQPPFSLFPAGPQIIASLSGVFIYPIFFLVPRMVSFSISSICDSNHIDTQFFAQTLQIDTFCSFGNFYSGQVLLHYSIFNFKLVVSLGVFFESTFKYQTNT